MSNEPTGGWWSDFKKAMTVALPVKLKHVVSGIAAGLVLPALYVVAAVMRLESVKEWISAIDTVLATLTTLFALLSVKDAERFKQVMPPLLIFAATTTSVAAILTKGLGL